MALASVTTPFMLANAVGVTQLYKVAVDDAWFSLPLVSGSSLISHHRSSIYLRDLVQECMKAKKKKGIKKKTAAKCTTADQRQQNKYGHRAAIRKMFGTYGCCFKFYSVCFRYSLMEQWRLFFKSKQVSEARVDGLPMFFYSIVLWANSAQHLMPSEHYFKQEVFEIAFWNWHMYAVCHSFPIIWTCWIQVILT